MARGPNLETLDPFDVETPGGVVVVVETTKGSRSKLAYDGEIGAFRLRHVLPEGLVFPFDFGFIPGTAGGDGDPLDVLVLLDEGLPTGTVIEARIIGVVEAQQRKGAEKPVENHRFLAVPAVARGTAGLGSLDDLRSGLLDEIEAFLIHYNRLRGIHFEPLTRGDPGRALSLIRGARRENS